MPDDHDLECKFDPILVPELLDGTFKFLVPSYQRGYRWGYKEITDLLEDLFSFMRQDNGSIYFLQPIVVRPIERNGARWWEVLDGQQRLTTILLVLKLFFDYLSKGSQDNFRQVQSYYRIEYANRLTMNFDDPDPKLNLDAFHVCNARKVIKTWIDNKSKAGYLEQLENIAKTLYFSRSKKKVCFIWYSVQENSSVRESIGFFNRLNKGKIRLTGSELVKALFVLANKKNNTDSCVNETNAVARFSLKWDEIVRQLQNDAFWYFISNDKNVQTRMDVLLTFVTGKKNDDDAYREFQKAYDEFSLNPRFVKEFNGKKYNDFSSMWEIITRGFDVLMRWYEDVDSYNYVGWLIRDGWTLQEIKRAWDNVQIGTERNPLVSHKDHCRKLRDAIKSQLKIKQSSGECELLDKDGLMGLTYRDNYGLLKKILLLFNVESERVCRRRFPFDRYEGENGWDLEHVDSQEDNNLQKIQDKIEWIGFVLEVLSWIPKERCAEAEVLRNEGEKIKEKLVSSKTDEGGEFGNYYSRIVEFFSSRDGANEQSGRSKDGIGNLTLLDAGTNRSYKNAPFPYKRYKIINREREGKFVPICTKNLFLKYYSDSGMDSQQIDMFRWGPKDQDRYLDEICKQLSIFMKESK